MIYRHRDAPDARLCEAVGPATLHDPWYPVVLGVCSLAESALWSLLVVFAKKGNPVTR